MLNSIIRKLFLTGMLSVSVLTLACVPIGRMNINTAAGYSEVTKKDLPVKKILLTYDDLEADGNNSHAISTVAKISSLLMSDVDVARSENSSELNVTLNNDDTAAAFDTYLHDEHYSESRNSAKVYKIYFQGKARQAKSESWVDDENLLEIKQLLSDLLAIYDYNAVLELHLIGAGTGATGLKYLVENITADEVLSKHVYLKTACFVDPVTHSEYYSAYDTSAIQSSPQILSADAKVLEIVSTNNSSRKLKTVPYRAGRKAKWLKRNFCPGSHSQVTGIDNDALSACALGRVLYHIDKYGLFEIDKLPVDDVVQLRLYNSIVSKPFMLRVMIQEEKYYQ